jgi:hypothetical protein
LVAGVGSFSYFASFYVPQCFGFASALLLIRCKVILAFLTFQKFFSLFLRNVKHFSFLFIDYYITMQNARQKAFLEALSKLALDFPVAEISRQTGYKEGSVSPYLKPEGLASPKFIRSVAKTFGFDPEPIIAIPKTQYLEDERPDMLSEGFISNEDPADYPTNDKAPTGGAGGAERMDTVKALTIALEAKEQARAATEKAMQAYERVADLEREMRVNSENIQSALDETVIMVNALQLSFYEVASGGDPVKREDLQRQTHNNAEQVARRLKMGTFAPAGS